MTTTNNTNTTPPSWMDNLFLENVLKSEDPTITVTSSDIKMATAAGDNYTSEIYRANVKFTRNGKLEQKSYIIKCSFNVKSEVSEIFSGANLFDQEINTFKFIHPEVVRLQKQAFKQTFTPFAANFIYSGTDENATTIFLEDLRELGYKSAEITTLGLDLKHCLLVMRKLAQYHAATAVVLNENPERFKMFESNLFTEDNIKSIGSYFTTNVRDFAKEIGTWPDYKERFGDKLNKLTGTVLHDWGQAAKTQSSEFKVLTHGDFKSNNMMFKYSERTGEVEDVRFVDFQLSLWSSPAIDLHYFLNSSASPELLENPQVMINEYIKALRETFQLLGYQHLQPSASHIKEQINNRGLFGVLSAICLRNIILVDRTKVPDLNKIMAEEGEISFSDEYKQSMRTLLPLYEKRGWI